MWSQQLSFISLLLYNVVNIGLNMDNDNVFDIISAHFCCADVFQTDDHDGLQLDRL